MKGKQYKVRYIGIDSQEVYYKNYTTEFKSYDALEKIKNCIYNYTNYKYQA